MAQFIDSSYFVGEIMLPNLTVKAPDINQAIAQYEAEILIKLLGYKLYKQVVATPNIEPFKSLIEGAEFTLNYLGEEILLKWEGLKNTNKQSLIAYYVFYQYVDRNFTQMTGVGAAISDAKNAQIQNPYPDKMVNAWNRMLDLYGAFPSQYIKLGLTDAPVNDAASAFNYLYSNIDQFPDWRFTPLMSINQFGI